MPYMISTGAHYHWVERITAETNTPGALKIILHGAEDVSDQQFNQAEITIFTDNAALARRLAAAINECAKAPARKHEVANG
jgi:hypothetical protein